MTEPKFKVGDVVAVVGGWDMTQQQHRAQSIQVVVAGDENFIEIQTHDKPRWRWLANGQRPAGVDFQTCWLEHATPEHRFQVRAKTRTASLNVTVPESVIAEHVRIAIVDGLIKDKDRIVHEVVRAALTAKKNNYDRETVLESLLCEEIRKLAQEVFREYLEERKADIRAAIEAQLKRSPQKLARALAEKSVQGIASAIAYKFEIKFTDEDR